MILFFYDNVIIKIRKGFKLQEFNNELLSEKIKDIFLINKNFWIALNNAGIDIKTEDTIKKWRRGVSVPKTENLPIIAELLNCSILDLFRNIGNQKNLIAKQEFKNNPSKYSNFFIEKLDENKIDIPYFENSYACAGAGLINYDEIPKPITFDKGFLEKQLNMKNFKNIHIIKVKGNSMEPTFKSGTFLMVNPLSNEGGSVDNGSIYVVQYYDDTMVKRVVRNNKTKEVLLHSDNKEEHPVIEIKDEDINDFHIIGRVIANFSFI
jgi:repressor LexA